MTHRYDVVVVGSGFAGSLCAWGLARAGYRVALVERGRHPRVALGESSTPLANLALERLALRLDSPELWNLATYGRWMRSHPKLRAGLKRGFSFYRQVPGRSYAPEPEDRSRLVVAASPDDEVADLQWWRADVDAAMLEWAVESGADSFDQTRLESCEQLAGSGRGYLLTGQRTGGDALSFEASFVVDASGAGGFLARHLEISAGRRVGSFSTRLVAGHLSGVRPFEELLPEAGSDAPYPESWGAVHQLLDRGWMYQLRFSGDLTSAGFVLPRPRDGSTVRADPKRDFARQLERFPTLQEQFADARFEGRALGAELLPFRLTTARGPGFLLLPQAFAFFDPLYSTGIAWSLVAVERVLDLFADGLPSSAELEAYGDLMMREADHLEQLIDLSYRSLALDPPDQLGTFAQTARIYFAAASYWESAQRLLERPPAGTTAAGTATGSRRTTWWWQGLLGATDPVVQGALAGWSEEISRWEHGQQEGDREATPGRLQELLASRDVAGLLGEPVAEVVPVDLETLVRSSSLLGSDPEQMRSRLPQLRSPEWAVARRMRTAASGVESIGA